MVEIPSTQHFIHLINKFVYANVNSKREQKMKLHYKYLERERQTKETVSQTDDSCVKIGKREKRGSYGWLSRTPTS